MYVIHSDLKSKLHFAHSDAFVFENTLFNVDCSCGVMQVILVADSIAAGCAFGLISRPVQGPIMRDTILMINSIDV